MKNILNFFITFFSVLIIVSAGIFVVGFGIPMLLTFLTTGGRDGSGNADLNVLMLALILVPVGLIIGSIYGVKISRKLKLK